MFGVTVSDAERDLGAEKACIEAIVQKVLLLQSNAAVEQHRPIVRGTHAKGTSARAQFEVFDVTAGRDPKLAARLASGIFAKPGVYPAVVRFANADPKVNSDFKADVRALSVAVDLSQNGAAPPSTNVGRQDFSLQNTTTLPINDARAFLATMNLLTASNPAVGMWSLPFKDKLRALRAIALVQAQLHQKIKPYQQLRYGSNVPFRHGPNEVVKYSAAPLPDNPAHPLQRRNPNALQDEVVRHLNEDGKMSGFDFGVQFLDADRMTYWGKRQDASFWTENASIVWKETEAPFHTVARLTLLPKSQLPPDVAAASYFDVTGNATPDSAPVGSINRARHQGEAASRQARMHRGRQV
jgi:catalase